MNDTTIKKQVPHDQSARRWSGLFFEPKVNYFYKVPENSSNHPEHRGRYGMCIDTRSSSFGMFWALIEFFDDRDPDGTYEYPKNDWIRTTHLIPSEHGHPVTIVV